MAVRISRTLVPRRRDSSSSLRPGALAPVFRFPRAVQLAQPKFALEIPRQLLEVVFIQAGIDRPHFFKIDAAPADMHVPLAVVVNMERDDARLAVEAEPLFLAVGDLHPLLARQLLAGCKPGLGVKERLRRAGVAVRRSAAASRRLQPDRGRSCRGRAPRRIRRARPARRS